MNTFFTSQFNYNLSYGCVIAEKAITKLTEPTSVAYEYFIMTAIILQSKQRSISNNHD